MAKVVDPFSKAITDREAKMSQAHFVQGQTIRLTHASGKVLLASVGHLEGGSYLIFAKAVVATVLEGAFVPWRATAQFVLEFTPSTPAASDVAFCMLDVPNGQAQPINTVALNLGASFSALGALSNPPLSPLRGSARLYCTLFGYLPYNPADAQSSSNLTIEVSHATLTVLPVENLG